MLPGHNSNISEPLIRLKVYPMGQIDFATKKIKVMHGT